MKTLDQLTELETLKLRIAQEHLRHCAALYTARPVDPTLLFCAAHEFAKVLDAIGMSDYWVEKWATPEPCQT